jgi:hypothetical protein
MPGVPRWPLTIRVVIVDWKATPPAPPAGSTTGGRVWRKPLPPADSRLGACAGARVDRCGGRFYNRSPAYRVGMAELVDALG